MQKKKQQSPATVQALSGPIRRCLSVLETADTLNLGMTSIYKLIGEGQLKVIKLGRRTLIPVESIDALLNQKS